MTAVTAAPVRPVNTPGQVLFASMIGTTIEFFDFYIYATAAVLVFPKLFFPASDPASATLASLATFAIAFVARPIGSALFGHFGDRVGRKTTLVAALLTMGLSTVAIGLLPSYHTIGLAAPVLLALCRFGQGLGLGGEWGGAVLLAVENAPPGRRAWYGMFPQLGAPIGFFFSGGVFIALSRWLTDEQFFAFGWRLPFLASAALVVVGLYVRLSITETPVFQVAVARSERVKVPMVVVFRDHPKTLVLGTMMSLATFVLFYLMTVFALSWGTSALHYTRETFLMLQLLGVLFFAITIPISAVLAERGRRVTLTLVTLGIGAFGLVMAPLLAGRHGGRGPDHDRGNVADGTHLWAPRHHAVRTLPHLGALYGQFAHLQFRGHLRRLPGALHRDLARHPVWPSVRRLLPHDGGRHHPLGAPGLGRDQGRRSSRVGVRRAPAGRRFSPSGPSAGSPESHPSLRRRAR